MPNVKAFDINQWIQIVIGTLLLAGLFAILKMYGDVETMKIEKRQDSQVILKLDAQSTIFVAKINELSQKIALLEQAVKIMGKTKGMEGMISLDKLPPPTLINPVYNAHTSDQHHAKSDCEKSDCLPPVPPPPPQPEGNPSPTKQ